VAGIRGITRAAPSRWQAAIALFLVVVGFLVVAQLRSRQPLRQATNLPSWRLQELAVLVRQQEAARGRLQAEVEVLERQVRDYQAALTEGRGLSEAMIKELQHLRAVLGLTTLDGPGVRVVLTPGAAPPAGILPPEVQAQDVAGLANELWSGGAEAIAINGVRILATTPIRQVETRIVISGMALAAPFRVEAIGDSEAMRAALAIRGGFVEGLRSVGLRVDVQEQKQLRLPARPRAEQFRYAEPPAKP
jgi:uncharacterized protein YlxW (UPF0749 family)